MGWFRRLLGLEKQPEPTAPEMPKADTTAEVLAESVGVQVRRLGGPAYLAQL